MRSILLDQIGQVFYPLGMRSYSVYEAKTQLSQVLRQVKRGMEIVVTERGHPVAKVIPLRAEPSFEEKIRHLTEGGGLIPARRRKIPRGMSRRGGLARFLEERE